MHPSPRTPYFPASLCQIDDGQRYSAPQELHAGPTHLVRVKCFRLGGSNGRTRSCDSS